MKYPILCIVFIKRKQLSLQTVCWTAVYPTTANLVRLLKVSFVAITLRNKNLGLRLLNFAETETRDSEIAYLVENVY